MTGLEDRAKVWILLAVATALVAPAVPVSAANVHVHIQGFSFQPNQANINVGDNINWDNHDGATHTATDLNCPRAGGPGPCEFDSFNLGLGGTFSHTFASAGTFDYECTIHHFTGRVVVGGGGGSPDLVVDAVTLNPPSPIATDGVVFSATVRNAGTAGGGAFSVQFFVDGVSIGSTATTSLGSGASRAVGSPTWTATAGTHSVRALADSFGQVAESSEANNDRTVGFTVQPLIRGVDLDPEDQAKAALPSVPPQAVYDITVTNTGNKGDIILLSRSNPPPGWTATLSANNVALGPGASTVIGLIVRPAVPPGTSLTAEVFVTGTSNGDATKSDTVRTETRLA